MIAVQHVLVVHRTRIQHITVQVEYIVNVINMSATKAPSPYRKYDDSMWITYINEAIQSGNHKRYCEQHNIIYRAFQRKYQQYQQSSDKENWSPKSNSE